MGILATNSLVNYININSLRCHGSREKPNAISDGEAGAYCTVGLVLIIHSFHLYALLAFYNTLMNFSFICNTFFESDII